MAAGSGTASTVATNPNGDADPIAGNVGDATKATLNNPAGIAVDYAGRVYIADTKNQRVRVVDAGSISTVAGLVEGKSSGDVGLATRNMLKNPQGVIVDGASNIYIADTSAHVIRMVDAVTQTIKVIAGTEGKSGTDGDGGAATGASLNLPNDIAVDSVGNLYIADTGNSKIRRVDPVSHFISTVAINIPLNKPAGVSIDNADNLYIADSGNNQIEKLSLTSGTVTVVAGKKTASTTPTDPNGDGGLATDATLNNPQRLAVDSAGNIYFSDSGNNRVREIEAGTGIITTVAGEVNIASGSAVTTIASLTNPLGIAVDGAGTLYISDQGSQVIRKVAFNQDLSLDFGNKANNSTDQSVQQIVTFSNIGNAKLTIPALPSGPNPIISPNFGFSYERGVTCDISSPNSADSSLDSAKSCLLKIYLSLSDAGPSGQAVVTDDSLNIPGSKQTIKLNVSGEKLFKITSQTLPEGTVGVQYPTQILQTSGGTSPYSYTYTGSLPTGLTLSESGVLSGTPTVADSFTFTITVQDSHSPTPLTASQSYILTVNPGGSDSLKSTITWTTPAAITYGTALSATQLNANSTAKGIFVYTPAAGTVLPAGQQTLKATFTSTDPNYKSDPVEVFVTLTVNQAGADSTITWSTPAVITYGTAIRTISRASWTFL